MTTRSTPYLAASLLAVLSGCVISLPDVIVGRFWCAEAFGANGTRTDNGSNVNIVKNGAWIGGCQDMCPFEMDIIEAGENGELLPMDPLFDDWQGLRQDVLDSGVFHCEQREAQLEASFGTTIHFNGMQDVTCVEAIEASNDIFQGGVAHIPPADCNAAEGDTEEDLGSGPGIYGLSAYSEVLNCSGTTNRSCNVDQEFIADVVEHPVWIWSDDAFLEAYSMSGVTGFKFTTCGSNSLLYALGFRLNDVLTHVDGIPVTTSYDFARSLWGHLSSGDYSQAVATFKRGSVTQTLTVVRVNLGSYP